MANLIITQNCNIRCPYCFASESRSTSRMSLKEFQSYVEKMPERTDVRFCGGEPTTHPEFIAMLDWTLSKPDRSIFIMTNGVWPKEVQNHFSKLSLDELAKINFLFNILDPSFYPQEQLETIYKSVQLPYPSNVTLGLTIYKYPFDYRYLIDLGKRFGIQNLRYSIAAPNISDPGSWLISPEHFRKMGDLIYHLIVDASIAKMSIGPDCGYLPRCAFTQEQLQHIQSLGFSNSPLKTDCPGSPTDIGPGSQAWRCYGLYSVLSVDPNSFEDLQDLDDYFSRRTRLLDNICLFSECQNCEQRKNQLCGGGCYTYRIIRLLQEQKDFCLFPIDNDEKLLACRPRHNKGLQVWERFGQPLVTFPKVVKRTPVIREYEDESNVTPVKDVVQAIDGQKTISQLVDHFQSNYKSREDASSDILDTIKGLFNDDALLLQYDAEIQKKVRLDPAWRTVKLEFSTKPVECSLTELPSPGSKITGQLIEIAAHGALILCPTAVKTKSVKLGGLSPMEIDCRVVFQKVQNEKKSHLVGLGFDSPLEAKYLQKLIKDI